MLMRGGAGILTRFNSRPREGATNTNHHEARFQKVSIRAPVRGRRLLPAKHGSTIKFQFAPPGGGDHPHGLQDTLFSCFNSRPREGATTSAF